MKALIVVPTHDSAQYIELSLMKYMFELDLLKKHYPDSEMLVVANGKRRLQTQKVLETALETFKDRKDCFVAISEQGKNNAINHAIKYARRHGFDAIHLLDDDVSLKVGSVHKNCEWLFYPGGKTTVVGSKFKVSEVSVADMIKKYGVFGGLRSFFWRTVFSIPYGRGNEIKTCSGQSICFSPYLLDEIPNYVADDAYICLQALKKGGSRFKIEQPLGSVVYFEPAHSLKSWYAQKLRTALAISESLNQQGFEDVEYRLAHKFSYFKRHRTPLLGSGYPLMMLPTALLFKLLLSAIERDVCALEDAKIKDIGWNAVKESKPNKL